MIITKERAMGSPSTSLAHLVPRRPKRQRRYKRNEKPIARKQINPRTNGKATTTMTHSFLVYKEGCCRQAI